MVKKLLLVAIAAFSGLVADAQIAVNRGGVSPRSTDESGEKVNTFAYKFGVKAGVNFSSMSNNENNIDPNFSMGTGFRVGGLVNLRWGQRTENSLPGTGWFGLQPEVMYSYMQYGTDADNLQMHAIQVPAMLKIYPTAQLSFEVGPEFTYIMSTSPSDMTITGSQNATGANTYNSVQLKTGDVGGLTVGIGGGVAYDFDMGLTIGARYSYGFTKMAKNLDWKASNIQVSVGWLF